MSALEKVKRSFSWQLVHEQQHSHSSSHGFGPLLQLRVSGLDGGGLLGRGERGEAGIRSWFQGLERAKTAHLLQHRLKTKIFNAS